MAYDKLVTREQWGAKPPKSRTPWDWTKVQGVAVHHSVTTSPRYHRSCAAAVRGIQNYHLSQNYRDIAYNAIVCGHGYTFVGRWTKDESGANGTPQTNSTLFAVCFLGTNPEPSRARAEALRYCRTVVGKLGGGSKIVPHRDLKSTACPGQPLTDWIMSGGAAVDCVSEKKAIADIDQRIAVFQARIDTLRKSRAAHQRMLEKGFCS